MIGLVYGTTWGSGFMIFYTKIPWKKRTALRIRIYEGLTYIDCYTDGERTALIEYLREKGLNPEIEPPTQSSGYITKAKLFSPIDAKGFIDSPMYSVMIRGRLDVGIARKLRQNNYMVLMNGENWILL